VCRAEANQFSPGAPAWSSQYGLQPPMGLLDEAIREHLELKRRRGADPAEVAREQREALDPVSVPSPAAALPESPADTAQVGDLPTEEHALDSGADDPSALGARGSEGYLESARTAAEPGAASSRPSDETAEPEETAELDMATVMDEPGEQAPPPEAHGYDAPVNPSAQEHVRLDGGSDDSATGSDSF
jgi:hypothetical protein